MSMAAKKRMEGYCFILPGFLYVVLVLGYPLVYNIILSFKDTNVKNFAKGTSVFVGFQNYISLIHDSTFQLVFKNTIVLFTLRLSKYSLICDVSYPSFKQSRIIFKI